MMDHGRFAPSLRPPPSIFMPGGSSHTHLPFFPGPAASAQSIQSFGHPRPSQPHPPPQSSPSVGLASNRDNRRGEEGVSTLPQTTSVASHAPPPAAPPQSAANVAEKTAIPSQRDIGLGSSVGESSGRLMPDDELYVLTRAGRPLPAAPAPVHRSFTAAALDTSSSMLPVPIRNPPERRCDPSIALRSLWKRHFYTTQLPRCNAPASLRSLRDAKLRTTRLPRFDWLRDAYAERQAWRGCEEAAIGQTSSRETFEPSQPTFGSSNAEKMSAKSFRRFLRDRARAVEGSTPAIQNLEGIEFALQHLCDAAHAATHTSGTTTSGVSLEQEPALLSVACEMLEEVGLYLRDLMSRSTEPGRNPFEIEDIREEAEHAMRAVGLPVLSLLSGILRSDRNVAFLGVHPEDFSSKTSQPLANYQRSPSGRSRYVLPPQASEDDQDEDETDLAPTPPAKRGRPRTRKGGEGEGPEMSRRLQGQSRDSNISGRHDIRPPLFSTRSEGSLIVPAFPASLPNGCLAILETWTATWSHGTAKSRECDETFPGVTHEWLTTIGGAVAGASLLLTRLVVVADALLDGQDADTQAVSPSNARSSQASSHFIGNASGLPSGGREAIALLEERLLPTLAASAAAVSSKETPIVACLAARLVARAATTALLESSDETLSGVENVPGHLSASTSSGPPDSLEMTHRADEWLQSVLQATQSIFELGNFALQTRFLREPTSDSEGGFRESLPSLLASGGMWLREVSVASIVENARREAEAQLRRLHLQPPTSPGSIDSTYSSTGSVTRNGGMPGSDTMIHWPLVRAYRDTLEGISGFLFSLCKFHLPWTLSAIAMSAKGNALAAQARLLVGPLIDLARSELACGVEMQAKYPSVSSLLPSVNGGLEGDVDSHRRQGFALAKARALACNSPLAATAIESLFPFLECRSSAAILSLYEDDVVQLAAAVSDFAPHLAAALWQIVSHLWRDPLLSAEHMRLAVKRAALNLSGDTAMTDGAAQEGDVLSTNIYKHLVSMETPSRVLWRRENSGKWSLVTLSPSDYGEEVIS